MNEQARKLAELVGTGGRPRFAAPTIALACGRGGVGKTALSLDLALALAREQHQVLLADFGGSAGRVATELGLQVPAGCQQLLAGADLDDVLLRGPERLCVLAATPGARDDAGDDLRLIARLAPAREWVDAQVVDLAPGIGPRQLDSLAAAPLGLVVTSPEPAACTDAYALVKSLALLDPQAARRLRLVVNHARDAAERERIAAGLATATERFLGFRLAELAPVCPRPAEQSTAPVRRSSLNSVAAEPGATREEVAALVAAIVARLTLRRRARFVA